MPYLRFLDDPEENTAFLLTLARITLGRTNRDVVLESPGPNASAVSRRQRDHRQQAGQVLH